MEFLTEYGAVILPMVKHPFVVGFLVAELPRMETETCEDAQRGEEHLPSSSMESGPPRLPPCSGKGALDFESFNEQPTRNYAQFTTEQKSRAIMISRCLALAYVMDQVAISLYHFPSSINSILYATVPSIFLDIIFLVNQ